MLRYQPLGEVVNVSCNKGFQVLWDDLMQDGGGDLREGRNAEWRDSPCVRGGE